jgi:hypothetical protein
MFKMTTTSAFVENRSGGDGEHSAIQETSATAAGSNQYYYSKWQFSEKMDFIVSDDYVLIPGSNIRSEQ